MSRSKTFNGQFANGSVAQLAVGDAAPWAGSDRLTVWIASNDAVIRSGVAQRLAVEPDIQVLGACPSDDLALALQLSERRPFLVLIDWLDGPMRRRAGRAARHYASLAPRVLLLARSPGAALVETILRHRLHGFLCAETAIADCVRAIRRVAAGEIWVPRALLATVLADLMRHRSTADRMHREIGGADDSASQVTGRERQIVMLVRQGWTNKQIGRELGIVEETVKKHLQHIYDKLGVRRRALLVVRENRANSARFD